MAVKRNYRINLRNYGNSPAIMVSQYDENYDLVFEVYDGVVPATGLNAYTVKLVGRQPGNDPALKYEFTGTVSGIANNILSFTIDTTMTGRAGKGTAEIVILDTTNDVKFASFNMTVYVEKAAVPDDAIDADVERAQEIADEVQDIVDTAAAEVKGEAESWAVGERDGEPVPSTDPTYHNNAKYYAEQAQDIADSIGIDATLSISGKAADAKKTGDEISSLKEDLNVVETEAGMRNLMVGFVAGAIDSSTGEIISNSQYSVSDDYIPVVAGTSYTVKRRNSTNGFTIFIGRYTSDKTFATRTTTTATGGTCTFTPNENEAYVKICVPNGVITNSGATLRATNSRLDDIETTISANKAEAKADSQAVLAEIESELGSSNLIGGYASGLINATTGAVDANTSYSTTDDYIPVTAGTSYTIKRKGSTSNFTAYVGAYESDKTFIERFGGTAVGGTYTFTAGSDVAYIKVSAPNSVFSGGVALRTTHDRLDDIEAQVVANKAETDAGLNVLACKKIRSDLSSDGIGSVPNCKVYKSGVQADAEFGKDDVRYEITLPDFDLLHLFFRYQYTAFVPYVSNSAKTPLFALGSGASVLGDLSAYELFWQIAQRSGNLLRDTYWCVANRGGQNSYNAVTNGYKARNGATAFTVRYTGEVDSNTTATLTFGDGTITYAVNGTTVGTISYNGTDTIQSLIDALDALTDLSASAVNTFGTCADLLLMSGRTLNLVGTYKDSQNVTQYQAYICTIPYARDDSWHTCEAIIDKTAKVIWVAFDGYTMKYTWNTSTAPTDNILSIGGNFNGSESPLRLRDLEIDINNLGSAEIVTGAVCSAYPTDEFNQLVSKHNPRLMILEGHGIIVGSEEYAQSLTSDDDQMAISTDRLNYVFDYLVDKGYVPVTMQDAVAWKMGKKDLPKRCFVCVFDDYRIANYVDYDKRKPFIRHNVRPALALITGQYQLTDTVTINGQTYTIAQALAMIKTAGWYPCSHTAVHRRNSYYSQSACVDNFKTDVLSCNDIDVYADVLVYPFGATNADVQSALSLSDFAIAINITGKNYNCYARSDYNLLRTEIGSRASIANVLLPFI